MQQLGMPRLFVLVVALLLVGCGTPSGGDGELNDTPPDLLTASFTIVPQSSGSLEGTWLYEFDASGSSDPDGELVEYRWDLSGLPATIDWSPAVWRGFGRNGSYDISLVVVDDEGNSATATKQLVIDDLPYDYWGVAPERVDTAADGTPANSHPIWGSAVSADGRYAAFTTLASNLGPADGNVALDVYLKDMQTGAVELISPAADGYEVSPYVAMSADADYIAFALKNAQTGSDTIYVREVESGLLELIVNDAGFESHQVVDLSADGRKLLFRAFTSGAAGRPAWVVDLETDARVRLGLRLDGSSYADVSASALSADGRFVVFDSTDDGLVKNDRNGVADVFVTHLDTGETVRVSESSAGIGGDAASGSWTGSVSGNGRHVVFGSRSTNFPGSESAVAHIYLKDLRTGELELISENAFGAPGQSRSLLGSVSDDGRYVSFGSYARNLVPAMEPLGDCVFGCTSGFIFVKDRNTGRVVQVTMGVDDTVPNYWDQISATLSANGAYVSFVSTATNLVPDGESGQDSRYDYYRASNSLWEE